MSGNAEILLMMNDGSLILQVRDNKPGITNPGLISSFGGHIEPGEQPIEAALREINEETNLNLKKEQLQFYRKCRKTREVHGEDWDVYYFIATPVSETSLQVYEGEGYTLIRNANELAEANTTILLKQVLQDYFDGFRSHLFLPDMPDDVMQTLLETYYAKITAGKAPTAHIRPVALACTGLVAAGKSTITSPLATTIDAVGVSNDFVREMFFRAGYNFKQVRPFVTHILERLVSEKYNIFLDFNISTNIPVLDMLNADGYQIYVTYANPPEAFIKNKILSGNMKHDLTFFPKDEYVYESMLTWKDEHVENLPLLREKYGIWREVDTSQKNLNDTIKQMQIDLQHDLSRK